jgi:hypothetical protein
MTTPPARPATTAGTRSAWTLPDDGITDYLAIEIAASGERPVALTATERWLAAARILARGGTAWQITSRLHVSHSTARRMAAAIRAASTSTAKAPRRAA